MFFLSLFVPVAKAGGAVKGEARAPIGSEEAHLLSGKKRVAVDQIAERQGTSTAREPNVNRYFDGYRPISDRYRVKLPIVKVERVTIIAGLKIWATRWKNLVSDFSIRHKFAPFGFKVGPRLEAIIHQGWVKELAGKALLCAGSKPRPLWAIQRPNTRGLAVVDTESGRLINQRGIKVA